VCFSADYIRYMRSRSLLLTLALLGLVGLLCQAQEAPVAAQAPAAGTTPANTPQPGTAVDNDFVQKQFGAEYTLESAYQPVAADLDNDGVEDIVIVARVKNPLADQADFNFKVLDPYDEFFGMGDPRITTQFATADPTRRGLVLCIIHGAGAEAWRSSQPKAKFVIINLPFQRIAAKRIQIRKKKVVGIYAEETGGDQMTSVIFFDGKKYKYQPMGASMQ
jgi:hypothetical protein